MSLHNERLVPMSYLEAEWVEWAAAYFGRREGRDAQLAADSLRELARKFREATRIPADSQPEETPAEEEVEAELSRLREQLNAARIGCAFGCGPYPEDSIHVGAGIGLVPACPIHGWVAPMLDARDDAIKAAEAENTRLRDLIEGSATDEAILQAAEARCAELEKERDAAMDAVGLPRTASLDDLIRHHRGNAATAAGFDQIAAEARCARLTEENERLDGLRALYLQSADDWSERCARLQQALEAARREAGRAQDVRVNRTRIIGNIALIADEALAGQPADAEGPDTPADSQEGKT